MNWKGTTKFLVVGVIAGAFVACSSSNSNTTAAGTSTIAGGASAALNAVSSVGGAIQSGVASSSLKLRAGAEFAGCSAKEIVGMNRFGPGPVDSNGDILSSTTDDMFALGMMACKLSGKEYSPEGVVGAMSIARAVMTCGAAEVDSTSNTYQDVTITSDATCFGSAEAGASMAQEMGATFDVKIRPTVLTGQAFDYFFEMDFDADGNADESFYVRLGTPFVMKNTSGVNGGWEIVLDTTNGIIRYDFNDQKNPRRLRMYVKGTMSADGEMTDVDEAAGFYFEADGGGGTYGPSAGSYQVNGGELFTIKGDTASGYATYHLPTSGTAPPISGTPVNKCIDGTGCEASAMIPPNVLYSDYSHLVATSAAYTTYQTETTEILSFEMTDFDTDFDTAHLVVPVTAAP